MIPVENLHSFLEFWARRWPGRAAVHTPAGVITWGELDASANAVAAGLEKRGIGPGDTVGVLLSNRAEFVQLMFGVFKRGAALVLLSTRYTQAEAVHPVENAGIRLVLTEAKFLPLLEEARRRFPNLEILSVDGAPDTAHFRTLLDRDTAPSRVSVDGTSTALICYTSGTTGVPKGALLSHFSIYSASVARSLALGFNYSHRVLVPLPLAFTGGAVSIIRDCIVPGATCFLLPAATSTDFLEIIERERITSVAAVTTIYEKMSQDPGFASRDLSSLEHAITGGAVPSLQLLETWRLRGVPLVQGYGLTETAGSYATILFGEDAERKIGSAGRKLPNVEISLRDESGKEVDLMEAGEIWLKGPIVTSGYLNAPETNTECLIDGWFRTGDIGILDEEGFYKIVDRSKDMLISGGLNVYPAEIERVLAGAGGLCEFVVIGVPDERWGEVPAIVAQTLTGVKLAELQRTSERELADYKRPKYIIDHNQELPRTLSGKVRKAVLRNQYRIAPDCAIVCKEIPGDG